MGDPFLNNAAAILDTAAAQTGETDWTILIDHTGQLRMIANSDWELEALAREQGARMAFRVTHSADQVRVEGRQGLRTCSFASEPSEAAMVRLLNRPGAYQIAT